MKTANNALICKKSKIYQLKPIYFYYYLFSYYILAYFGCNLVFLFRRIWILSLHTLNFKICLRIVIYIYIYRRLLIKYCYHYSIPVWKIIIEWKIIRILYEITWSFDSLYRIVSL